MTFNNGTNPTTFNANTITFCETTNKNKKGIHR